MYSVAIIMNKSRKYTEFIT